MSGQPDIAPHPDPQDAGGAAAGAGRLLEFRVLAGPQRGCRLPLRPGVYTAGSHADCDILLDDLPADQTAFTLRVDAQRIELEPAQAVPRRAGEPVSGTVELAPGQAFTLGSASFAVDERAAPWPEEAHAEDPVATTPATEPEAGLEPRADPDDLAARRPPPRRRRAPFWALWLAGTAAFLCGGTGLMLVALSPARARTAAAAPPALAPDALSALVGSARDHADLQLTRDAAGHWRIAGYIQTNDQKVALIRAARAADPLVRVDVEAEDDMRLLADDTLHRLDVDDDLHIASMHSGELMLAGQLSDPALIGHLQATLLTDVPGLRRVRISGHGVTDDDPAATLRKLLEQAGLADRIDVSQDGQRLVVSGKLSQAELDAWVVIRNRMFASGSPLELVERFRTLPGHSADSDIVLVVQGPVPYVMHDGGAKEGRSYLEETR